jgi:hypothetical protein
MMPCIFAHSRKRKRRGNAKPRDKEDNIIYYRITWRVLIGEENRGLVDVSFQYYFAD